MMFVCVNSTSSLIKLIIALLLLGVYEEIISRVILHNGQILEEQRHLLYIHLHKTSKDTKQSVHTFHA